MALQLYPDLTVPSVFDITADWLTARGFKAVICDLDDTLVPYFDTRPHAQLTGWLAALRAAGVSVCVLTNGKHRRVAPMCRALQVPFVSGACKPLPFGYLRALRKLGVRAQEALAVGDQIFTDIIGGNLVGLQTLLVEPIAYKTSPFERKKRGIEKRFRRARRDAANGA